MEKHIEDLVELGKLDARICALEMKAGELPGAILEEEANVVQKREGLESARKELIGTQKEADGLSVDMQAGEEQVRKFRVQLGAAKSNKEYDVIRRQIDARIEENARFEEGALVRMEKADELKPQIKEKEKCLAAAEDKLKEVRAQVEAALAEIEREKSGLLVRRREQAKKIDPDDLTRYERILVGRKDSAVARVDENVCSACNMTLNPQALNLVLLGRDIVECQGCSRILYWEDEPGSR